MKKRPIILAFIRHYLPGNKSGGPVRTLSNMVAALGEKFEFRIITSDRDILDANPYENIAIDQWVPVGEAYVYYTNNKSINSKKWKNLIATTPHDILYLNSLFDYEFTILPLLSRPSGHNNKTPTLIAPRGELSEGALKIKKFKKLLYLKLARTLGLYDRTYWHASSQEEKSEIIQNFGNNTKVYSAINVPQSIPPFKKKEKSNHTENILRIVFLSRISRKKNLNYALSVVSGSSNKILFDIWGTIEDASYWEECQKIIKKCPENVTVNYKGIAEHCNVNNILSDYDLFFFPTMGENYGHVIAEALSAGTPVLISNATPWNNLEASNAGWTIPLSKKDIYLSRIDIASKKSLREKYIWSRSAYEYAKNTLMNPSIVTDNEKLFSSLINH